MPSPMIRSRIRATTRARIRTTSRCSGGAALLLALLVSSGCAEPEILLGHGAHYDRAVAVDMPSRVTNRLDLLFVVDNTTGMKAKQDDLAVSFRRLMNRLEFVDDPTSDQLLDVQVGVISTDLGVGPEHAVNGCTALGDGGALRGDGILQVQVGNGNPAHLLGLDDDLPGDGFPASLHDRGDLLAGDGDPARIDDAIQSAFASMAALGTGGCRFEQPLAAMRAAIERSDAEDLQLVRPDAALAIVFLSNEDDCSIADDDFFRPDLDRLGQADKFRCFQYGVHCTGDDVWPVGGTLDACGPREDSPYVASVGGFVDYLRARKDPEKLVVAGIIGDSDTVEIRQTTGEGLEVVSQQCDGVTESRPAIRLQGFVDAFGDNGTVAPLCGETAFGALDATAHQLRKTLGTSCLDGDIADIDPDRPGRQALCFVSMTRADGRKRDIPRCNSPSFDLERATNAPCHIIGAGYEGCGDFQSQLALKVWWGHDSSGRPLPAPEDARIVAECLVEPDESALQ